MKKVTSICAAVFAFVLISTATPVFAAGVSVGATMWYAEWDPVFSNLVKMKGFLQGGMPLPEVSLKTNSAFLIGPMISISFLNKFNFATVFTMGKFDGTGTGANSTDYGGGNYSYFNVKTKYISTKTDLDSSISYALFRYMKIFAGIKYQGYSTDVNMEFSFSGVNTASSQLNVISSLDNIGGGAGIALAYPLINNIFVICNISGVYMRAYNEYSMAIEGSPDEKFKDEYNVYGGNASISCAYYFASLGVTVSLGGRYQYLKYYRTKGYDTYGMNKMADKFYGVVLSAVYSF